MTLFRALLLAMLAGILVYTSVTISHHGLNLIPPFFAAMQAMDWQGQFNLDFLMVLTLAGLWTAWRNGFTPGAIVLGIAAAFFGIAFLSAYLLYLTYHSDGDVKRMLLGVKAADC